MAALHVNETKVSTRLSIATQSLAQVKEFLMELGSTPSTQGFRQRLEALQREVDAWTWAAPDDAARRHITDRVLELHVDVMRFRREAVR